MTIVNLITRVIHPPIKNPNSNKTITVDDWDSPLNIGIPRYTGWAFDKPWEVVPGKWTIQILDGTKVLAEKEFVVNVGL